VKRLDNYYLGDQIEKNEVGGACSMCGGEKRCIQGLVGRPEESAHLEGLSVDGMRILKWIFGKWDVGG